MLSLFRRIPCLRQRVLVNLTDRETAIQGVLYEVTHGWFRLKSATHVQAGSKPVAMDGDVLVDRDKVLFVQVL